VFSRSIKNGTVIEKVNLICEKYKKTERCRDPEKMKPIELHPKQIASRLKKPNKIAVPYSFWEAGFLFITPLDSHLSSSSFSM